MMDRERMIAALADKSARWDIIIIGGGATGLGCAVDAASRGYRTVLLEQGDFAKGTSSRSTKLIHGGVRYLKQGNLKLVRESLRERALLLRNAPALVKLIPFILPNYAWWERPFYGIGLTLYGLLAREGKSRHLNRREVLERLPTLRAEQLRGGIEYFDGQFDDARLAMALARTAAEQGAIIANYLPVIAVRKQQVIARDAESGAEYELKGKVIINATGVFCDRLRGMDEPDSKPMVAPSQGAHIVLDRSFLPGNTALMVPRTRDGRVMFAIPWHDRVLVGTTDTPITESSLEPKPLSTEIDFLLEHAAHYLAKAPSRADVKSAFAGLRPLVKTPGARNTALVPRDHTIVVSPTGMITVTGGKWTTYRNMAEETIDRAEQVAGLEHRLCKTASLPVKGKIEIDVTGAVREEMARTLEDYFARRTRTRGLFLDARATLEAAPKAAAIMRQELGGDEQWEREQLARYRELVGNYLI
jgi:glycerol-3-phosphate dehydrogenase